MIISQVVPKLSNYDSKLNQVTIPIINNKTTLKFFKTGVLLSFVIKKTFDMHSSFLYTHAYSPDHIPHSPSNHHLVTLDMVDFANDSLPEVVDTCWWTNKNPREKNRKVWDLEIEGVTQGYDGGLWYDSEKNLRAKHGYRVRYVLHHLVPTTILKNDPPSNWSTNNSTNFGKTFSRVRMCIQEGGMHIERLLDNKWQ